jgi:hypothetical protein
MLLQIIPQIQRWCRDYKRFIWTNFVEDQVWRSVYKLLESHDNILAWVGYWVAEISTQLYQIEATERWKIKMAAMLFGIIMGNIDNITDMDNEKIVLTSETRANIVNHFLWLLTWVGQAKYHGNPYLHEIELLSLKFHEITWSNPRIDATLKNLADVVNRQVLSPCAEKDSQYWLDIAKTTGGNTASMTLGFAQNFTSWTDTLDSAIFTIGSWLQVYDDITDRYDDTRRWQRTFATECSDLDLASIEKQYREEVYNVISLLDREEKILLKRLLHAFRVMLWVNSKPTMRLMLWRRYPKSTTPSTNSAYS